MFGFLKPMQPSRDWSQSYARICQIQRSLFGVTSLPFLSYEAAFGIFLLGVKLQDDLVDSNRWYNRMLWVIYRARVRSAERILDSLSPGLVAYLASCIERYLALQNRRPILRSKLKPVRELQQLVDMWGRRLWRGTAPRTSSLINWNGSLRR